MKKITFILIFLVTAQLAMAQPPGYYNTALGKNGAALQTALKNIIDNHSVLSYPLWGSFSTTDNKGSNILWDMYSDQPGGTANYIYTIGNDECGNYNSEGDCYNHEHVWPKSYYNDAAPMNSDLHHVIPTDGWVNNKRSNFPIGTVNNTNWTSSNGTKLGNSATYAGYTGKVFEPIDEYKGDFARMFFYTSTRYNGEDNGWNNWEMATGAVLTADAAALLLQWHQADTVSQKEIDRNNAVYALQGNRNPFIDYPVFAECIWGTANCTPLNVKDILLQGVRVFPNPANDQLNISLAASLENEDLFFELYNTLGQPVLRTQDRTIATQQLPAGIYSLKVIWKEKSSSLLFIKK